MDFYTMQQRCKGKGLDEYILSALVANPLFKALGKFDDIEIRVDKDDDNEIMVDITFRWYNIIKM